MQLFLTPSDVLFFRSGFPFQAGESSAVQSVFPPTPETVQGALRAMIAARWAPTLTEAFTRPDVRALVGDERSYGRFRLDFVTIGRRQNGRVTRLFPAPAHLLRVAESARTVLLRPADAIEPAANATNLPEGMRPLMPLPDGVQGDTALEPFGRWLEETELRACLRGDAKGIGGVAASDIYTMEPRIGIGLRRIQRTAEEGLLYETSVVRMHDGYGLVVAFHVASADAHAESGTPSRLPSEELVGAEALRAVLQLPEHGWLPLGGERHAVSYEVMPDEETEGADGAVGRSLIYFGTPAYFQQGWRPPDWEAVFGAQPIAAAIGGKELIGGWRQVPGSAGGSPKPLHSCVPAGSVYFFESYVTKRGPYTEYGREIGYGHAIEGAWS